MKRLKNIILKSTVAIAFLVFMVSACALDSATWLPAILCLVSFIYIALFYFANSDLFERWWD